MSDAWGHKLNISVYFDEPWYESERNMDYYIEQVNLIFDSADFIGIAVEEVQEEPHDQGCS